MSEAKKVVQLLVVSVELIAKVVCVLYDDPKDGYPGKDPSAYPREQLPKITHYPDQFGKPGQTAPTPKNDYVPQTGILNQTLNPYQLP